MASFFSHPAFPVALYVSRVGNHISKRLLVACSLLTLLPDADVIAFRFGIPYQSQWGHRGFTHSITFALFIGFLCTFFYRYFQNKKMTVFWWTFLSLLSHSFFDALTNGGLGVAAFWPFTSERYFLPWHVVEVSPIGVRGFMSMRGIEVVLSEIVWIWLPCLAIAFGFRTIIGKIRGKK